MSAFGELHSDSNDCT
jgi:hypothetical protein